MGRLQTQIKAETKHAGGICGVKKMRAALPKDLRAEFDDALASAAASTAIAHALDHLGYGIGGYTIQRHRRGDCGCGRAR